MKQKTWNKNSGKKFSIHLCLSVCVFVCVYVISIQLWIWWLMIDVIDLIGIITILFFLILKFLVQTHKHTRFDPFETFNGWSKLIAPFRMSWSVVVVVFVFHLFLFIFLFSVCFSFIQKKIMYRLIACLKFSRENEMNKKYSYFFMIKINKINNNLIHWHNTKMMMMKFEFMI